MNRAIDSYRYHEAAQTIWHFIYDDFCDWYIELKKISGNWNNLLPVFDETLRLLHPVMPFITEELWHTFGNAADKSISLEPYPQFDESRTDAEAERKVGLLQEVVRAVRNLRSELGLDPKAPLEGHINIDIETETVRRLTNVTFTKGEVATSGVARRMAQFDLSIDVPAGQMEALKKRQEKERELLERNIANTERQLGSETFTSKAPVHIIDSMKDKLAGYRTQLEKLNQTGA